MTQQHFCSTEELNNRVTELTATLVVKTSKVDEAEAEIKRLRQRADDLVVEIRRAEAAEDAMVKQSNRRALAAQTRAEAAEAEIKALQRQLEAERESYESGIAQQEEVALLRREVQKWQNRFRALQIEGAEKTTEREKTLKANLEHSRKDAVKWCKRYKDETKKWHKHYTDDPQFKLKEADRARLAAEAEAAEWRKRYESDRTLLVTAQKYLQEANIARFVAEAEEIRLRRAVAEAMQHLAASDPRGRGNG